MLPPFICLPEFKERNQIEEVWRRLRKLNGLGGRTRGYHGLALLQTQADTGANRVEILGELGCHGGVALALNNATDAPDEPFGFNGVHRKLKFQFDFCYG